MLKIRDDLQQKIDAWHIANNNEAGQESAWRHSEYVEFLGDIGYLAATENFPKIATTNVDPEIAEVAGPQLVVPVSNARFAINAANIGFWPVLGFGHADIIEASNRNYVTSVSPITFSAYL